MYHAAPTLYSNVGIKNKKLSNAFNTTFALACGWSSLVFAVIHCISRRLYSWVIGLFVCFHSEVFNCVWRNKWSNNKWENNMQIFKWKM